MPFLSNTAEDRRDMLAKIGISSTDDLFQDIPSKARYPKLNLPKAVSEIEILAELKQMASKNKSAEDEMIFLGAGAYHHFVPSVIPALTSRGEFLTAYTPYQPEVSQGTLQAMFEYQSMIANLTGMEVVNASHYDGATAMAEAAIMAMNVSNGKRNKIIVAPSVHPQYRQTLRTYLAGSEATIVGDDVLQSNLSDWLKLLDKDSACLIIQNPTFFGELLDVKGLADAVHAAGALLIVVANPAMSLGLLTPPGKYGADIVVAEGQPFGAGLNFGGPYLGIFATLEKYMRKMPGRLIGKTVDKEGRGGFVLTLSTREQHIRREKATSNICSNESLIALTAAMYLSYMGKQGLRAVAEQCYHKAHFAAAQIAKIPGFSIVSKGAFFDEFVVQCPCPVDKVNETLLKLGIVGGYNLEKEYSFAKNQMLVCVTEMNSRAQIDALIAGLKTVKE